MASGNACATVTRNSGNELYADAAKWWFALLQIVINPQILDRVNIMMRRGEISPRPTVDGALWAIHG